MSTREVTLKLETAHSALAVLKSYIAEKVHADDRKEIDSLVDRIDDALCAVSRGIALVAHDAQAVIDRL